MRFRLATDNPGTRGLSNGIGSLVQAMAMAPLYQAQGAEQYQNAEQKRQLTDSQIGQNVAKTAIDQLKADQLKGRPDVLNLMGATRANMSVPEFKASISERTHGAPEVGPPMIQQPIPGVGPSGRTQALDDAIMSIYGPAMATPADKTNWDQLASARGQYQDQGITDQAVQAATGGDNMLAGALSAVRGKRTFAPFSAVGNTGTALNEVTGAQPIANEGLRALFGDKVGSEITENKAQANSANASAGAAGALTKLRGVQTGNAKLDGGMKALDYRAAVDGKPLPSANKPSRGADSTNAKAFNAIVAAVEKDPMFSTSSDEEIMAEVNRRASRRGMSGPADAPTKPATAATAAPAAPAGPKIDMKAADSIKADFKAGRITKDQARAKLKKLGMD